MLPVLKALRGVVAVPISIDTRRAVIAAKALEMGAEIINDVSALADPAMADVVARYGAGVVLMHGYKEHVARRGCGGADNEPRPSARIGIDEVEEFLEERVAFAVSRGIERAAIVIDPGLGFGKTNEESVAMLREARRLSRLGLPVLIGPSRKRFLAEMDEAHGAGDRDEATAIAVRIAIEQGAAIVRVHEVKNLRI